MLNTGPTKEVNLGYSLPEEGFLTSTVNFWITLTPAYVIASTSSVEDPSLLNEIDNLEPLNVAMLFVSLKTL